MDASLAPNLGYPKARLVFLLECLQDLSSARLKSAAADDSVLARVAERGAAVTAAQTELSNLKRKLKNVAGRNPEWRVAISSALDLASPRTDVVEQLGVLLQLARVWQTGETQLSLLCSQFELAAVVEAASAARERAKQSRSEAAGTGANAVDKDSSAINLLEARMLGEMAALYDALSNAREATQDKRYKIPLANATARIFSSGQDAEKPKPPSPPQP